MIASRQPQEPPLGTTDRLLAATEQILLRQGAHAVSIRRIAATSGLNSALVSYHFGGLGPLLRQLLERNVNAICDLRDEQQTAALQVRTRHARLEAVVHAYLDPLWQTQAIWHLQTARAVIREVMPMLDGKLRRRAVERINASVTSTAEALVPLLRHLSQDEILIRLRLLAEAANIQRQPQAQMGLFPLRDVPPEKLDDILYTQLIRLAMGALQAR